MRALPGVPVLERSGVFWLSPELDPQLSALRSVLLEFRGWELHEVKLRSDARTLEALSASSSHWLELTLAQLSSELEALLCEPRQRASLLVRKLDTLETLRRQAEVHRRQLGLTHQGLLPRLDSWAARIDAALCARIVA